MTPFFNPGPIEHPRIPIFIAAVNPYHVRRGGRVLRRHARAPVQQPEVPARDRAPGGRGRAGAVRARRARTSPTPPSSFVVVGDTPRRSGASRPRWSSSRSRSTAPTRTYQPVLDCHGWEDVTTKLHRKSVEGDWKGMADLITDEMLRHLRGDRDLRQAGRDAIAERYDGTARPHRAVPALPAAARTTRGCPR